MELFQDYMAHGTVTPTEDSSQDFRVLSGYENGTHTVVTFERNWDTCDNGQVNCYFFKITFTS